MVCFKKGRKPTNSIHQKKPALENPKNAKQKSKRGKRRAEPKE